MSARPIIPLVASLVLALSASAHGESLTELSGTDLRALLDAGKIEDPRRALDSARQAADGEILDIRAFRGQTVYYRVLVKRPDGQVLGIVVNGQSGDVLAAGSDVVASVNATARSAAAGSQGAAASAGSKAGGAGDGNAGGNGQGGHAGGNGQGNGGGGGGGNGSGAGNGNGGGNGHGNGNGNGNGGGNGKGN